MPKLSFRKASRQPSPEKSCLIDLYPDQTPDGASKIDIDIVAVHGLNGTVLNTWTDPENKKLWLRDFLPQAMPKSRIMSYGYNASAAFSLSTATVDDFASDILNRIRGKRTPEARERPLLFICHSLGGVIVKRALCYDYERQDQYRDIVKATRGVVFMGTPHRGSKYADAGSTVSKVINFFGPAGSTRVDLLNLLQTQAEELWRVSQLFVERSKNLQIISFYECDRPGLGLPLVVSKHSAVLGLPNELAIPIAADHRAMCRFSAKDSQLYLPVEKAIEALCQSIIRTCESEKSQISSGQSTASGAQQNGQQMPNSSSAIRTERIACCQPAKRTAEDWVSPSFRAGIIKYPSLREDIDPLRFMVSKYIPADYGWKSHIQKTSVPQVLYGDSIKIEFTGDIQMTLEIPSWLPITDIASRLRATPEDESYFALFLPESTRCIEPTWRDVELVPVPVTSGPSRTREGQSLAVCQNETLASFFSRVYRAEIDIKLQSDLESAQNLARSISVSVSGSLALEMSFHRTVKVPDDGIVHSVPSCVGRYPIFNVDDFEDKLPEHLRDKGGVFLPIFDLQALGIVLSPIEGSFAIRTSVGGVNTISGRPLATMSRLLRNVVGTTINAEEYTQDYIVSPNQSRLDGIAISPGCVAQFVATQMKPKEPTKEGSNNMKKSGKIENSNNPSRPSIEHQLTSEDAIGGIQLELIPAVNLEVMFFSKGPRMRSWFPSGWPVVDQFDRHDVEENATLRTDGLDPMKTPAELGLSPGECLYMKNMRRINPCRPKTVSDLLQEFSNRGEGLKDRLALKVKKWNSLKDVPLENTYNHLFFLTLTGRKLTMRISKWDGVQVYALKAGLQDLAGPIDQLVLFYKGRTLHNDCTIDQYDIHPGDVLLLCLRRRGGAGPPRFIYNGEEIFVGYGIERDETILSLKKKIAKKLGAGVAQIILAIESEPLLDEQTMADIKNLLRHDSDPLVTISIATEPAPELTIGAGGVIKQKIQPDKFDRSQHWDWHNSRFLHISLLNGALFHKVTGVPPPSSLLAPTSLVAEPPKALPYNSFSEDGISGDWSGVRTLAEFEILATEKIKGFTVEVAEARDNTRD